MLNGVERSLRVGRSFHGFMFGAGANDHSGVVQLDGRGFGSGLLGLAGVAGMAIADISSATERGNGDHQRGNDSVLIHVQAPGPQSA